MYVGVCVRRFISSLTINCTVQQTHIRSPGMILRAIEHVKQNEDNDFYALSQDTRWQLAKNGEFCLYIVTKYMGSFDRE